MYELVRLIRLLLWLVLLASSFVTVAFGAIPILEGQRPMWVVCIVCIWVNVMLFLVDGRVRAEEIRLQRILKMRPQRRGFDVIHGKRDGEK